VEEKIIHNRRVSDEICARLTVAELSIEKLEKDINDHKGMTERMCRTLDDIRIELSAAKGFLKAMTLGSTLFMGVLALLFTIQWLKIPA
jgi:hypothetical protein